MSQADNHVTLLQGANDGREFSRALATAKNDALAEEYSAAGGLEALEFADGSRLAVNQNARTATVIG